VTKRPRRRAEDRPREICRAALEVFAEKGFAAAKLDEIAARAGVAKGTLYLYFKDKEDLFRAVIRDTVAPNVALIRENIASSGLSFAELVPLLLGRFADMTENVPVGAVAKIVIGESRNFPELAKVYHDLVVSQTVSIIAGLIKKAQAAGEVRAGDPRLHAMSIVGPMIMGVLWRETLQPIGAEPIDLKALASQQAQNVLTGLLVDSSR
jgi:AcrR family transcriptional regulator